jgi:hypothetical protein
MTERYDHVLATVISRNFVSNDNMPPCDSALGRHACISILSFDAYCRLTGQCTWTACVHKHTEEYRGQGDKPAEEQKDQENRATAEEDGPMPGTTCLNCKEEPQYREKGKVNPYCGITCASEAGALGGPQQSANLSNNAMIQEEDTTWMGSNYMSMAGISREEMWEEAFSLGFVVRKVSVADTVSVYSKEFSDLLQDMGFIFTD